MTCKNLLTKAVIMLFLIVNIAMATESPKYQVTKSDNEFELRTYQPQIVAETVVSAEYDDASGRGFRILADYIFGNNSAQSGSSAKIAMTAPVTMSQKPQSETIDMTASMKFSAQGAETNSWTIQFVMPSEYNLDTLPKPNNKAVNIRQTAQKNYAVIRFSWFTGEEKVNVKTQQLLQWMQQNNLQPTGKPELARYDHPATLPMNRRNEIMIPYK